MDVDVPLAEPPDGQVPDFHGLSDLQVTIIAAGAITLSFAMLLLIVRIYTTIRLVKKVGWDLLLIVLAWVTALGFFVAVLGVIPVGLGRHYWNVTASQVPPYMSKVSVTAVMYMWPLTLAKLSLLVVYHRINPEMVFKYCLYIVAALVLVPTLVYMALAMGPCDPRISPDRIQCIYDLGVVQAATNIATDVILIAMPLSMVRTLNASRRKKIALGCLMGLGSSVVTFSILRTCFLQAFIHNQDFTYHHGVFILTSILEVNFGVICACLPLLQPFLKRYMPQLALSISHTAWENERRNKRALREGVLGRKLSIKSIEARFSPRRWRMGVVAGDGAREGYSLHTPPILSKAGRIKDSTGSMETRRLMEPLELDRENTAYTPEIEEGRGLPLLADPMLAIHHGRMTSNAEKG